MNENPIETQLLNLIDLLNGLVWGNVLIYVLLISGAFFTIATGFVQFRYFGHMLSNFKNSRNTSGGISPFQAFCTGLAARVGTGNLAGVAVAIVLGGPGAVFWMWLVAIIGMATSFVESTLAQTFKVKNEDGSSRGGPAYYIQQGLGSRTWGIVFALCLMISFGFAFNGVQANSISDALELAFDIPDWVSGIFITLATAIVIWGGTKRVAVFVEYVVPVMALAYILIALIVVLLNIADLPAAVSNIVSSALGFQEAGAGALGAAMMNGIKRGLFSNEAGMGSAANAAATANPNPHHPATQGFFQMFGVFVDTIVICTCTAAIILLFDGYEDSKLTGIQLTQVALSSHLGDWSGTFLAIVITFFAFTSIVANYSYAESNLKFITEDNLRLQVYRLILLAVVMYGSIGSLPLVWNFADLTMGVMALVNLVALCLLFKYVRVIFKDYQEQHARGELPVFEKSLYPEIAKKIDDDVWSETREEVHAKNPPL
ncbi:alanine/glycine:cation symporter family protein [Litoribrevibacter albus]|uniref:Sodium:alanine symporter n=1 Tax=Litoribrevibacter albus TaxID=1473156 RepID=A0AA37SD50_9GAMM|nr:alanine/glycine:cation symporter family protein [Litoribrevibacter albus]GLQ32297.1 sodium:alanine symporter [Litoribrevibacter albus]